MATSDLSFLQHYRGESAALFAALCWAISSVVYARAGLSIKPLELNFLKGVLAIILILVAIVILPGSNAAISSRAFWLLFLSGVLGIGLGDTAYFGALNHLGPRRALLMETLAPPLAGVFGLFFLHELLSILAWSGIFLTICGIALVISEREAVSSHPSTHRLKGVIYGLAAAIAQASGAVLSRAALAGSTISALESTLVRLIGGVFIICCWLLISRQQTGKWLSMTQWKKIALMIAFATFLGTFLGIWLQQISLKFTQAGIAQTLLATSPLFILPIAAMLGEKISVRSVLGVLFSLAGIFLLFSS